MCGIAGIIDETDPGERLLTLKKMLGRIQHRGPDESGIYRSQNISLGSVRLSIIDPEGGQQPMTDPSGRYWIVYNGEIYNYLELRSNLQSHGYHLKTRSDTEVLLGLFIIHGKDCLQYLNGQFAFAVWDSDREELFVARDRVGIRPLYYYNSKQTFLFASEIKSIFAYPSIPRELEPRSLKQIFTFWSCITPSTVFRDIHELPPGSFMIFAKGDIKIEKYWEYSFSGMDHVKNLSTYVEEFHALLEDSIRIRLRADVEVAAYLSGGLDSTTAVAYIKEIEPGILNTFSIEFEEQEFNELSFQQEAVKYLDTNHTAISCSASDILNEMREVIWHCETPLMRTSPIPMFLLSRLVREHNIKVVITGEGADEVLAGYNIFKESEIRRFWARQPGSTIRPKLLSTLYPYLPQFKDANSRILQLFFAHQLEDIGNPYYSHILRWKNANQITKFLSSEVNLINRDYDPIHEINRILPKEFAHWDTLAKAQWIESSIFMSGYLLSSQGDRMTMANSVEGRYPFLDHRIIEYLGGLPDRLKLKGLNEKYLLKQTVKGKIPDRIVQRPKQAYRAPVTSMFLSSKQPDFVQEMLSHNYLKQTGIFDQNMVSALFTKVRNTRQASELENMAMIAILSTQITHNQFIDGNLDGINSTELKNIKIIE